MLGVNPIRCQVPLQPREISKNPLDFCTRRGKTRGLPLVLYDCWFEEWHSPSGLCCTRRGGCHENNMPIS